jgi:hypothetical protein
MAMPTLIYCAGNNPTFCRIAVDAGYRYGARLPATTYAPVYFADQDYKRPDRQQYMTALARHRPCMATVLDWEEEKQYPEVLSWAEEASQYCQRLIVIPKIPGSIARLPRQIHGREVVLGYAVPTAYGATCVPLWEFRGWPVHLLGGSPQRQMREWRYLSLCSDVVSADGNMANLQAHRGRYWSATPTRTGHWQQLHTTGDTAREGANTRAFKHSCTQIYAAWCRLTGEADASTITV